MSNRNNESGFSSIEALLLLLIVVIIGGVGFFVYHSKNQADKTLSSAPSSTVSQSSSKTTSSSNTDLTNDQIVNKLQAMIETYEQASGTTAADKLVSVKSYFNTDAYNSDRMGDISVQTTGSQDIPAGYDYLTCAPISLPAVGTPTLADTGGSPNPVAGLNKSYPKDDVSVSLNIPYKDGSSSNGSSQFIVDPHSGLIVNNVCLQ